MWCHYSGVPGASLLVRPLGSCWYSSAIGVAVLVEKHCLGNARLRGQSAEDGLFDCDLISRVIAGDGALES